MIPTAMSLAEARFKAALSSGTSSAPVALTQLLSQLSTDSQSQTFDVELIGHSIGDEFPFLRNMISSGTPPDEAASAAWEAAVRWVLNALRNWDSSEVNSLNKLRALLGAVTTLDANRAGLSSVSAQVNSNQLTAGLQRLIESTDATPAFDKIRFTELRQQIEHLTNSGNLEQLLNIVQHMNFFPNPDLWTAVEFIYSAEPTVLSRVIERKNNALFSLMICNILEIKAIALAPKVDNYFFKFFSAASFRLDRTVEPTQSSQGALQDLLLQIARRSAADWSAWMKALFKYPGNNPTLEAALAEILPQLSKEHLMSFFQAISLTYSHKAATPVANILIPLANSASANGDTLIWRTAYQVWSEWNYGLHETRAMFAPVACAVDFPVSMYYASLPSDERLAEESSLLEAIETVEQTWFNSLTDLVTERNRLKSCLRLVQHGIDLANGSAHALPQPIQPDADAYSRTRYHYHDVSIF